MVGYIVGAVVLALAVVVVVVLWILWYRKKCSLCTTVSDATDGPDAAAAASSGFKIQTLGSSYADPFIGTATSADCKESYILQVVQY